MIQMSNALDPALITAEERLDEVARILALGVLRLQARQRKTNELNHLREFRLDFPHRKSVHGLEPADSGEGR